MSDADLPLVIAGPMLRRFGRRQLILTLVISVLANFRGCGVLSRAMLLADCPSSSADASCECQSVGTVARAEVLVMPTCRLIQTGVGGLFCTDRLSEYGKFGSWRLDP